MMKPY